MVGPVAAGAGCFTMARVQLGASAFFASLPVAVAVVGIGELNNSISNRYSIGTID